MKIIQITDLHIGKEGESSFGVDVRRNFLDILKAVKSLKPDFLAITGDICFDVADKKVYAWVKSHLDFLGIPYAVIGGNHDESLILAKMFKSEHLLVSHELYFKRLFDGYTALFLDTSTGLLSEAQLMWLDHELRTIEKNAVIFMHHPPIMAGVPHMDDNYPLQNMDVVQAILFNHLRPLPIFCGHYHVEKTLCARNLTIHLTPSTFFQIDWSSRNFKIDHFRTALREITLRPDGIVGSTVIYYEGNKL